MIAASDALRRVYQSAQQWISYSDLQSLIGEYLQHRPQREIELLRERRDPVKRLRDEILPTLSYLQIYEKNADVQFPLNNDIPDCRIRSANGQVRGIEVTVSQARAQVHLGRELNEKGWGRGFLGLQDDAPQSHFDTAMARERTMYSTESLFRSVEDSITSRIQRKSDPKYDGLTLIIEAPLHLEENRWAGVRDRLRQSASNAPFSRIYVVNDRENVFGFRIK